MGSLGFESNTKLVNSIDATGKKKKRMLKKRKVDATGGF